MSHLSHSVSCSLCKEIFVNESYALAKAAKDKHYQTCRSSVDISYANGTVRLERSLITKVFTCQCNLFPDGHAYSSVYGLQKHVQTTGCLWAGEMPMDADNNTSLDQSIEALTTSLTDVHFMSETSSQLEVTDGLTQFGLVFNTKIQCLICIACKVAIPKSQIASHLAHKHRDSHIRATVKEITAALQGIDACDVLPDLGTGLHDQIQGLPVHSGLLCAICHNVYGAESTIIKHHRIQHASELLPKTWDIVPAQQLNFSTNKTYFQVKLGKQPPINHVADIVSDLRHQLNSSNPVLNLSNMDPRLISPWLKTNHWLELIAGKPINDLLKLVAPIEKNEFPGLSDGVLDIFLSSHDIFSKIPELVLQQLNTPDPSKTGINNTPFHPHQDHIARMKEYASPIVRLVAMLLRGSNLFKYAFPSKLTKNIQKLHACINNKSSKEIISVKALYVLSDLWTMTWMPTDDIPFPDPTINCLALLMLQHDGSFKHPKYTTPTIARLEYCMRYTFMIRMYFKSKENHTTIAEEAEQLRRWYMEKVDSTFNSLRSLQHRATAIAESTMALPRVWWIDRKTFHTMLYEGNRIEFKDLQRLFVEQETSLIEQWEKEVLCGLNLHCKYGDLTDDLANTSIGYSFISDPKNPFQADRDILLRTILQHGHLRQRFTAMEDSNGKLIWNQLALRRWLYQYAIFEGLLLVRSQMLGGSPSRGSELTAMTFQNIPTTTNRNLVAFGKFLAFLITYHKGTAITQSEKLIPHALDAITSDLIIQNLAIARPFAQVAVYLCFPNDPEIRHLYESQLFVNNCKLFTTTDVSAIMGHQTEKYLGVKVGIQSWRQISIAFKRKLAPAMDELADTEENDTIEARQATHSRRTENRIYGLSADAFMGVAEDILPLYLDASTDWQIEAKVVPGGLGISYHEARAFKFDELVQLGAIKRSFQQQSNANIINIDDIVAKMLPTLSQQLSQDLLPAIKESIQETIQTALANINVSTLQTIKPELQKHAQSQHSIMVEPEKQTHIQEAELELEYISEPITVTASVADISMEDINTVTDFQVTVTLDAELKSKALACLQKVLNKPEATWSCPEQQEAVLAVLKCKQDVGAFLKTGAGKTMLAILPALLEKSLVTVVILPLRSLMTDYKRKLTNMGVQFEHFTGAENESITGKFGLILVSADKSRSKDWRQVIGTIHEKRGVNRLIFDEAHFALTSDDFRPALRNLGDIRSIPVQLCLLSGTVPPYSQDALLDAFNIMNDPAIIRMCTDRPELEYNIQPGTFNHGETITRTVTLVQSEMLNFEEKDRALVFISLKDEEGLPLSAQLGCEFYHGGKDLSNNDRDAIYGRWIEGIHKVMVCTNSFSAGNDYAHVRLVVHAGTPKQIIGYIQEIGRAGRDGHSAKCVIIPRKASAIARPKVIAGDHKGMVAMWNLLFESNDCIRYYITNYNDGTGIKCGTMENSPRCSRCRSNIIASIRTKSVQPIQAVAEIIGKRSFNESTARFQVQSDIAKKARIERSQIQDTYISHFEEALATYTGICAFCYMFGKRNQLSKHSIVKCPTLNLDLEFVNSDTFRTWQRTLHYKQELHGIVCFFCHLPQLNDEFHGTIQAGGKGCREDRKDLVAPIAYGIYHQETLKEAAEKRFNVKWSTLEAYSNWCNGPPEAGHRTNLSALFLWYTNTLE